MSMPFRYNFLLQTLHTNSLPPDGPATTAEPLFSFESSVVGAATGLHSEGKKKIFAGHKNPWIFKLAHSTHSVSQSLQSGYVEGISTVVAFPDRGNDFICHGDAPVGFFDTLGEENSGQQSGERRFRTNACSHTQRIHLPSVANVFGEENAALVRIYRTLEVLGEWIHSLQ